MQQLSEIETRRCVYSWLLEFSKAHGNNSITRGLTTTALDLDKLSATPPNCIRPRLPYGATMACYSCRKKCRTMHADYVMCCYKCGSLFQKLRRAPSADLNANDLHGQVALVIGGRTKLGHQIVLKLLRLGAFVYATSRHPAAAAALFAQYEDANEWINRLNFIYLDLNVPDLVDKLEPIFGMIMHPVYKNEFPSGHLDILINVAAQTIRVRDAAAALDCDLHDARNRYGDVAAGPNGRKNCWNKTLVDMNQSEMEAVFRINSIAPTLIIQAMLPLLRKSGASSPFIINVHAKEGLFDVHKSSRHLHTNMGKAALHMMTLCVSKEGLKTEKGQKISVHGVDPGWISMDEYGPGERPFEVAPLDEVDGAAKVLYPIFSRAMRPKPNCGKTLRHYFKYCV